MIFSTLGFQNTCRGFFSTPKKGSVRMAKIVAVAGERLYRYHYLYRKEEPTKNKDPTVLSPGIRS
jgi:hypothetical protein